MQDDSFLVGAIVGVLVDTYGVIFHCMYARCVVVCGAGKGFSAGLDVKDPRLMDISSDADDPARRALRAQRQARLL